MVQRDGRSYVYLPEEGASPQRKVQSRVVGTGRRQDGRVEITSGLQAGASVAVTAQRLYTAFTDLRAESDVRVRQDVAEINGISTRVANALTSTVKFLRFIAGCR